MKSNILPLLYAICGVVILCCCGVAVVTDNTVVKDIVTHGVAALAGLGTGIGLGSAKKDANV